MGTQNDPISSDELFMLLVIRDVAPVLERYGYSITGLRTHPIRDDAVEFQFSSAARHSPQFTVSKARIGITGEKDALECGFKVWRRWFLGYVVKHVKYDDMCDHIGVPRLEQISLAEVQTPATMAALKTHLKAHAERLFAP